MNELKKCPFCGREVELDENKAYGISYILCDCGMCTSFRGFESAGQAIHMWNTRKREVKVNGRNT